MTHPIPQHDSDPPTSAPPDTIHRAQRTGRGRQSLTGRSYSWAHVCRDGEVVCGRVELTIRTDTRSGLTRRERRCIAMRFVEHLHPALHTELTELVHRRGAAARRAAQRMEPVELVFEDPGDGLQRIIGWLEPPQVRHGDLREIEFSLRESAS